MDNTPVYRSKYTINYFNFLNITRIIWPLQSPDLNTIKYTWDYIRTQIKKKKDLPITDKKVISVQKKEWQKILIKIINK